MLGLITGVPGAKKTVFVVSKLDKTEMENKVNLVKNITYYQDNNKVIIDNNLQNDFTYYYDDVGSGHSLRQVITVVPDGYFDILNQEYDDLRPDDYYKVATIYNGIINRILEIDNIKGFKYLLPVRTIYSNINALKIDFTRSLYDLLDDKNFVDWRKAPDGSIIVIDEIQLVEPFKQAKNKDEPIIQDLTVHRHRGFDFYLITQSANLLHVQIKDLIGLHWHITVPWGWVSKVYQYGSYRQNPNAVSIKMSAERKSNFSPPDRLFKLYKSTTINTHQKRIPYKPLMAIASVIIVAFSLFMYAVRDTKDSSLINGMMGNEVAQTEKPGVDLAKNPFDKEKADSDPNLAATNEPSAADPTLPPMTPSQDINDAPQYFDPLNNSYIKDINLVPVHAVSFNGRCSAYNNKGNIVVSVSAAECKAYLAEKGMLPKV